VGEEAGAGDVLGVEEAMACIAAIGHAVEVILVVLRGEESAEVVIEPPGDFGRGGVFEVDDGVLVAGEVGFVKEGAGAVDEAAKLVGCARVDAFLMETAE